MSVASTSTTAAGRRMVGLIVLCGGIVVMLSFGIRAGFGLFLKPISGDLGWGREVFALSVALQQLLWGLGQPVAGAVADRFGSGRTIVAGALLYVGGLLLMGLWPGVASAHLGIGVLIGFGLSGTSFPIVLAAMARASSAERRSLVLGIGTAAGSFGQFALVPLGQAFLADYGWQTTLLIFSAMAALMLPLAGMLTGTSEAASPAEDQTLREALAEAGGDRSYWYLTAGFFVCGFHVSFIGTHLPAYLEDQGAGSDLGAWAIGLIGLFNIAGAFTAGVLGGRLSKKYVLSFLYFARGLVIAVYVLVPVTTASTLVFAAMLGLLWLSTVPLTSGLVAQKFGPRYMATLFGIVYFSHQIGSFFGAWCGGYFYDATGSYDAVWWATVVLAVFSGLIHWPIDEKPVARLAQAA